ncbi:hypothetical protein BG000_011350 [Podila horticola]|nr:hypothetical protein BG000_011350 [Podila horticola]
MHSGRLHQSIQQTARSHSALDKYPFGANAYGYYYGVNTRTPKTDYLVTIGRKVRGYFAGVRSSALDEIIRFSPGTNLEDGAIKTGIRNKKFSYGHQDQFTVMACDFLNW